MFYENFIKLCAKAGKTPSAAAKEIGISKSTVSNWKTRGTAPTDVTLTMIANYFGCDISELSGEGKKETVPMDGLSEKETEFIVKLRCASAEIQQAVWAVLKSADSEGK